MNTLLRYLFFILLVKPIVFFLLGINIRHREWLPKKGPAILVANHNSHLDTIILMSLFPIKMLSSLRPVAAADYFMKNRYLAWFSKNIIGILPIERKRISKDEDPLEPLSDVLLNGGIVIFYPEGTRGEPEKLAKLKSGIAYLASKHPDIDITPVFLYGAGKALPKGEALLVPFVVDVYVGKPERWSGDKHTFIEKLERVFSALKEEKKISNG
jgi:1-acyl-sn-glycerol-3-phosphate acyltransferase